MSSKLRRSHRHLVGAFSVITATVLLVAACGGGTGGDVPLAEGTPKSGGTLVTRVAFSSTSLDPGSVTGYSQTIGTRALVDSLVFQKNGSTEFTPWLATSWKVNKNATQYQFTLRDGVTFSNGEKLDAEAVRASFQRIIDDATDYRITASWIKGVRGITVVNPRTVIFDFSTPSSSFLQAVSQPSLGIVAPSFSKLTYDQRQVGTAVIGSGPFVATENRNEEGYTLSRRAGYNWAPVASGHQGAAYLDKIEQVYVSDNSLAVNQLLSGDIDLLHNTNAKDKDLIAKSANKLRYFTDPVPSTQNGMRINDKNGPTAELAVRRAIQLGTDTDKLLSLASSLDKKATNPVLASSNPYWTDQSTLLVHDQAAAERLLDGAGWIRGADGIRVKNGKRLAISLIYQATGQPHEPQFTAQQLQLKQLGIDEAISQLTPAEATKRTADGDWSLSWGVGNGGIRPDADLLRTSFSGSDPALDAIFEKTQSSLDFATKKQLTADATKLIYEQGLFLPYYDFIAPIVYRNSIALPTIDAGHIPWLGDAWKAQ